MSGPKRTQKGAPRARSVARSVAARRTVVVCLATSSRLIAPAGSARGAAGGFAAGGVPAAISFIEAGAAGGGEAALVESCDWMEGVRCSVPCRLSSEIPDAMRLRPETSGEGVALAAAFSASIQPPGCLPGIVGCSKRSDETEPRA